MRWILLAFALIMSATAPAQSPAPAPSPDTIAADPTLAAPVVLEGQLLFRVRGSAAIPAKERAAFVLGNIRRVADDPTNDLTRGRLVPQGDGIAIVFGDIRVVTLFEVDAQLDSLPLNLAAEAALLRLRDAIAVYREAREPSRLLLNTLLLLGFTLLAAGSIWACLRVLGWLNRVIEERVKTHVEKLEKASHRVIHSGQVWALLGMTVRGVRTLTAIGIGIAWLNTALSLYPWTRPFARDVFNLALDPLARMGVGIVSSLPKLVFLLVLYFVVRALLRVLHAFFERVGRGWIRLDRFDNEWAMPTYRIIRVLVIAFALVVAYPYIPGSDSEAFKGVGLFMGVILSIGSTSFIANMLAGYSLTYRGAYRIGDLVRIGEHIGKVEDVRSMSTLIRSPKNEQINIPNSVVLTSAVTNYSIYERDQGLLLHTEVSIGYDTPWRQVDALLLLAAERTEGVTDQPPPFVLQRELGDFAVTYQLNAYCHDAHSMMAVYSRLHGNIQDVFNEHGVQIMSPHYEADPTSAKIVPPDSWYPAPAADPERLG
jgi:small-conductance mechanosensitive channel